jgi:lipoprotein signal peptidase
MIKRMSNRQTGCIGLALVIGIILFDQGLKLYIHSNGLGEVENRNFVFGLVAFSPVLYGLVVVSSIVVGIVGIRKPPIFRKPYFSIGLSLLLGGLFSNLLDRILLGYVRDGIRLGTITNINIADIALTTGFFIVIASFFHPKEVTDFHGK